jgi:hypothetical protein
MSGKKGNEEEAEIYIDRRAAGWALGLEGGRGGLDEARKKKKRTRRDIVKRARDQGTAKRSKKEGRKGVGGGWGEETQRSARQGRGKGR